MASTGAIHDETDEFWSVTLDHPMVVRFGEGSPDEESFRYWVRQDYAYLVKYSRLFTLGAAKVLTLDSIGTLTSLLEPTVNKKMGLHQSCAVESGIDADELEVMTPSPTAWAYTNFLVRTATFNSFGDIVAALLLCMWGFNETERHLTDVGVPDYDQYVAWVGMYADDKSTELADWCKTFMDDVAASVTESDRERYHDLSRAPVQYEHLFWDAVWR